MCMGEREQSRAVRHDSQPPPPGAEDLGLLSSGKRVDDRLQGTLTDDDRNELKIPEEGGGSPPTRKVPRSGVTPASP